MMLKARGKRRKQHHHHHHDHQHHSSHHHCHGGAAGEGVPLSAGGLSTTTTATINKPMAGLTILGGDAANQLLCQTTFAFQPRKGKVDLRAINRLDVAKIAEDVDIDALQVLTHTHISF